MKCARAIAAAGALAYGAAGGWLDVPFVQQTKYGCGPAAIAMVMQYWAREVPGLSQAAIDSERVHRALPAESKRGIRGQVLKAYLEERGFQVFVFNGELADLRNHFEKGRPVVVCFAPDRRRGGLLHYAVVAGVDDEAVMLNDPARGKLVRERLRDFEGKWKATDRWSLLAVPRPGS